jgi:hypothetical protein
MAILTSYLFATTGTMKSMQSFTPLFMWMTNGQRFTIKLTQFAEILGLSSQLDIPKKLHTGSVMAPREMTLM